ncbi:MAG: hypothetical protein ABIJ56_13970 [Pseudomonadota bacterium]
MKLLAACLLVVPLMFAGKWSKISSINGITVWLGSVKGTDIKEAKGFTMIDAEPEKVWAVIDDNDKMKRVVPHVKKSREVGSCGKNCKYEYKLISYAPLKDRHVIIKVKSTMTETGAGKQYKRWWIKTKDKKPEPQEDMMEILKMYGQYDFVPTADGGKTEFTYMYFVDYGGSATPILVNTNLPLATYKFLNNLRKEAEKSNN